MSRSSESEFSKVEKFKNRLKQNGFLPNFLSTEKEAQMKSTDQLVNETMAQVPTTFWQRVRAEYPKHRLTWKEYAVFVPAIVLGTGFLAACGIPGAFYIALAVGCVAMAVWKL
jgi:hypothetical protein